MSTNDSYQYWRDALTGKFGAVHEGHPQPGFYRKLAYKRGPFLPVAIWAAEGGAMTALVDGKPADAGEVWTFCCQHPITEEAYHRAANGGGWADEPPPAVRSNLSSDPHEALTQEYQGEIEAAREFLAKPITTKDQADQAAIWSKRLATIAKKATDLHKVEKQPSLDEGRRVDERWRELKDGAADWAKRLKRHLDGWLHEQERIEQERQRLAREEAARKQREADDAARLAARAGDEITAQEADRKAAEAAAALQATEARNAQAGRTGAKVALRTFVSAEIIDFDALLMALKDKPEIIEVVEALANRAARAGMTLPGMAIKSEKRAA